MTNKKKTKQITIGMLPADINHKNDYSMWRGVVDAAARRNVNVICFPGLQLQSPEGFDTQANAIYELVSGERLDGLVIMAGAITRYVGAEERRAFFERFYPLPIVTLESNVTGIPDIFVDFYDNMRKAVLHLIQVHYYRRIAFIRGPEEHQGAADRYRGYLDALAECGIPFDPSLVTPPLLTWDGRWGVTFLLEQQQAEFEAVVAVNDGAAMDAIETLRERGISVPEQVAVIGFDDVDQGRWITPPLTTVPLATYTSGQQALEMILALIEGKPVPEQVITPTELLIRQSCGCIDPIVTQAVVEPAAALPNDVAEQMALETVLRDQQDNILAGIKQTVNEDILKTEPGQMQQLVNALAAEQSNPSNGTFLRRLDQLLSRTIAVGGEIEAWYQVVSLLRRQLSPYLHNHETLLWAENLWQQAQVLIGKAAQRMQGYQEVQAERRMNILREVGAALITTFDSEALMNVLAQQLPRLDIHSAYLSLYEDPKHPAGQARLLLAYNEQGRIEIEAESRSFPATQLIPQELWPGKQPYHMVALPLYFQKDQLGFVLFEANAQDGPMYIALRGQISSALKGALLVEQEEKRARQLQTVTEVGRVVSTILDKTELLQRVVDLTKASFNLYHAHIYLLNETGNTLNLAAGAGEVGRQMVTQGWSIALTQEQSLVARAARNRQGVIENNVRKSPEWLPNPLLPNTYAELAVPIVVGEQVLGVLDIQSQKIGHFTEEDVRIQTTLAGQVAVALQNARSFDEQQQAKLLLGKRVRELNCLNEIGREIAETPAIPELLQWITERIPPAMQHPELCVAAIEYEGQVYGRPEAIELPYQIVHALRAGVEVIGRVYISYIEKHDFLDEESALLGGIASRVSGYIESRHLLEQILDSEARYRAIAETMPGAIYQFTVRAGVWTVDYIAPQVLEMFGVSAEDCIKDINNFIQHIHPDDLPSFTASVVEVVEKLSPWRYEGRYVKPTTGEIVWWQGMSTPTASSSGEIIFNGILLDITERKQVEDTLRQANFVVENSPVVLFRWQAAEGWPVEFVSSNVSQFGYTAEEFLNGTIPYAAIVYPNDLARLEQELQEYAASEVNQFQQEYQIVTREGQVRWVDNRSVIERDEHGKVTHYQGTIIDITERKQAATEHERLLAEVEVAYRQYIRREWEQFLGEQQGSWRIEHQRDNQHLVPNRSQKISDEKLAELQDEVIRHGKTKLINGAGHNGHKVEPAIVAPIALRGQVIGTLSLQDIASGRKWTDEEMALVQTVSEQLALTIENLRLFDTTQKRATREALTREIADKIRQANTVEEILQTSVAELSKTLGVSRVFIDLSAEESGA